MAGVRELLQFQINGSFNLMKELTQTATREEWTSRPFPGANLIGFTVWHCVRTIDWTFQCFVRQVPEVAERREWRDLMAEEGLAGAGVPLDVADNVARRIPQDLLRAYLETTRAEAMEWLKQATPEQLVETIDLRKRIRRPEYLQPSVWEEIASLDGIPTWQMLARPSMSHVRVHYGEVQSQLQLLRSRVAQS